MGTDGIEKVIDGGSTEESFSCPDVSSAEKIMHFGLKTPGLDSSASCDRRDCGCNCCWFVRLASCKDISISKAAVIRLLGIVYHSPCRTINNL